VGIPLLGLRRLLIPRDNRPLVHLRGDTNASSTSADGSKTIESKVLPTTILMGPSFTVGAPFDLLQLLAVPANTSRNQFEKDSLVKACFSFHTTNSFYLGASR